MAIHFNEINQSAQDDFHALPDGNWTIAGWIKLDDNTGTAFQYILSSGVSGANPSFSWFIIEASHVTTADRNNLRFNIGDNDTTVITTDSTGQPFLSNTAWTHLTLQRSGSTITQYVNGVANGAVTNASFDAVTTGLSIFFGRRADGDVDRYFGGSMAEFAGWDRALSAEEILALSNGFTPAHFQNSLVWYIPFLAETQDRVSGETVGNNNGATFVDHPRIITPSRYFPIGIVAIVEQFAGAGAITFGGSAGLGGALLGFAGAGAITFGGTALFPEQFIGEGAVTFGGTADINFNFSFKWSIEHTEGRTNYGFPTIWVEVNDTTLPTGAFPTGAFFERRILEIPRVEEIELDSRFGIAGFQRVALVVDNSDGLLNGLNMQGAYIRMFFVNAEGSAYKEFKGQIVDWSLSHRCVLNIEDIDAIAIAQDFPVRTINELIEAEKIANVDFEDVVIANDLGKPIPIVFGRAIKVPLLYVKADEVSREYDYIIGEGIGFGGDNFQSVFTAYRNDQALDSIEGTMAAATSTTLTLESADQRPGSWYKYWWAEMLTGNAAGQITNVTAYDSTLNKLTVATWGVTPTSGTYRLREWRFYDGSQANPYAGYAFIRFKKRMGVSGRTDPIYADVSGLGNETNPARAIQSLLSNPDWGLGLDIDTASFASASALVTNLLCEGAIIDTTGAVDVFSELLGFRDMVLRKDDEIQITVDQAKTSSVNLGLGDETGWNNILTVSPEIIHIHPNEKVKNLKVRYRKNNKENDLYQHELERSSSPNGVDTTVSLPFIYSHESADRWLDYKRKRFAAAVKRLAFSIGQDGDEIERGDLSTVTIPTLGMNAQAWEITGASVVPAGENTVSLVPYSATPYTYVPITDEGGTLPVDESFDIPPDYTQSIPDPVTGVSVTMSMGIVGFTAHPFALLTWTPPEDNYSGAVVSVKLHADATTLFRAVGTYSTSARIEGLIPGQLYDFLVESLNVTGEFKGLGVLMNNSGPGYVAGGDSTAPAEWMHNLTGSAKFGKLVWTWTKHPESDVSHYIIEIYTATSGGSLLLRSIVPHENNASFSPRFEYQRQTGDLTSSLVGALRVAAVDHSGNTSTFTARFGLSTGEVTRPDARNNDFSRKWAFESTSTQSLASAVQVVAVSATLLAGQTTFIDASWEVKFDGTVTGGVLCGYEIQRNGVKINGSAATASKVNGTIDKGLASITLDDSPGAGTWTYRIWVYGVGSGSTHCEKTRANITVSESRR